MPQGRRTTRWRAVLINTGLAILTILPPGRSAADPADSEIDQAIRDYQNGELTEV